MVSSRGTLFYPYKPVTPRRHTVANMPTDDKNKDDKKKTLTSWERDVIITAAAVVGVSLFLITFKYVFRARLVAAIAATKT